MFHGNFKGQTFNTVVFYTKYLWDMCTTVIFTCMLCDNISYVEVFSIYVFRYINKSFSKTFLV